MAGFKLPKLRWLVIGAAATGIWAMTQDPPKREHWQRKDAAETAEFDKNRKAGRVSRPGTPATPEMAAAPIPRPSSIETSSIPRPESPAETTQTLRVTEKVRLRKEPSLSSAVVSVLKAGEAVEAGATDGKWRRVAVGGKVGWVHGDYLGRGSTAKPEVVASVPRPTEPVGPKAEDPTPEPISMPASEGSGTTEATIWGAMRPSRSPQGGDCQCPYDLMLNGKECGTKSAYSRGKQVACFF